MKEFIGFGIAGAAATALNYLIFLWLLNLGFDHFFAAAIGYQSGIAVSFLVNRRFVYQKKGRVRTGYVFGKYWLIYSMALPVQLGLLGILVFLEFEPAFANLLSIGAVLILNFLFIRRFVF